MDVTTVNDRHLYEGRVVVRDPEDPSGQVELAQQIVRFGPPGWLTVADVLTEDADVTIYPTGQVLSVSRLRDLGGASLPASASH